MVSFGKFGVCSVWVGIFLISYRAGLCAISYRASPRFAGLSALDACLMRAIDGLFVDIRFVGTVESIWSRRRLIRGYQCRGTTTTPAVISWDWPSNTPIHLVGGTLSGRPTHQPATNSGGYLLH